MGTVLLIHGFNFALTELRRTSGASRQLRIGFTVQFIITEGSQRVKPCMDQRTVRIRVVLTAVIGIIVQGIIG